MNLLSRRRLLLAQLKKFIRSVIGLSPIAIEKSFDNNSIINYKIEGNSVQDSINTRNLPDGYTEIEYIESTGTQYIDTGVIPNENMGFDIVFLSKNKIDSSDYGCILGARLKSQSRELQLTTFSGSADYLGTLRYAGPSYNAGISVNKKMRSTLMNKIYTNNEGYEISLSDSFTSPVPLAVFALNQNGSITQYGKTQLYSLKLYDGEALIRDFVPCYEKKTQELGLYDLVNNKFYKNNGTGKFVKGAYIPSLEQPMEVESVGDKTINLFQEKLLLEASYVSQVENGYAVASYPSIFNSASSLVKELKSILKPNVVYTMSAYVTNYGGSQSGDIWIRDNNNKTIFALGAYGGYKSKNFVFTQEQIDSIDKIYIYGRSESPTIFEYIQLEEGDRSTEYVPYGYKIPVRVEPKNIANIENFGKYTWKDGILSDIDSSTGSFKIVSKSGAYGIKLSTLFPKIEANKSYYLFANAPNARYQFCYLYGEKRAWDFGTKKTILQSDLDVANGFGIYGAPDGSETQYTGFMIVPAEVYEKDYDSTFEPYQEIENNKFDIYLDEPLRKVGNYADYIDFENQKVVRNVKRIYADNNIHYRYDIAGSKEFNGEWAVFQKSISLKDSANGYSNKFRRYTSYIKADYIFWLQTSGTYLTFNLKKSDIGATTESSNAEISSLGKAYVNSNPIYFDLATTEVTEEPLELPILPTIENMTTAYFIDTDISPSNIEITYYSKESA